MLLKVGSALLGLALCAASLALAATDSLTGAAEPPLELDLERALTLGLDRAPEIRAAQAEVERVRATIAVVRSAALPYVSLDAEARRRETIKSTSALGLDETTYGATLRLVQPIYTFGRLGSALVSAREEEAAALAGLAQAQLAVRLRVESAFLVLLLGRQRAAVAAESLEVAGALLERATVREAAGVGMRLDVERAAARRAAAEADLVATQAAERSAEEALAVAMGLAPTAPLAVQGDLVAAAVPVAQEEAERLALAERPDLAILRCRILSSRALTRVEQANRRPSLDLTSSASYTRHDYITQSPFFQGRDQSAADVAVEMTVPIFDGFRARQAARRQGAVTEALEAQLERATLEARREVSALYRDLAAAGRALEARRESARAAAEALRLARVSFDAGRATGLDVIQASLTLADARRAAAEAAYQVRLALARLVQASGTTAVLRPGDSP